MDIKLELRRAELAEQLLENPLYREAYQSIEAAIVNQLAQLSTSEDDARSLRYTLIGLRKVRTYMANVVTTGKMTEMGATKQG